MKRRHTRYYLFGKRKCIKGRRPRRKRWKFRTKLFLFISIMLFAIIIRFDKISILPSAISMSRMRIQTISTQIINQAVEETLKEEYVNTNTLATYSYDEQGFVISCGVNTVLVNKICAQVIKKITENVELINEQIIYIPFGKLVGNGSFSNYGPKIKVIIRPYGTAKINYDRAFVSTGINQVNYRVWLDIEMMMQVVIPFDSTDVIVNQEVILVDQVINGGVPDSYVNVPDEDSMQNFVE